MDRDQFRLIRANPQVEVPRFLAANGISVKCADPFYTESARVGEVTDSEYRIFTSLFKTDLFAFDHGDTSIDDQTGIEGIQRTSFSGDLIRQAFAQPVHDLEQLFASFCGRNCHRYPLRPDFEVPGRHTLREWSHDGGSFVISRAGTNDSQTSAVVYIGYFGGPLVGVGYLVGLLCRSGSWRIEGHTPLWVS